MKVSRKFIEIGFPVAIAFYNWILVAGHVRVQFRLKQELFESKSSSIHIEACTFEHLYDSFSPRKSSSGSNSSTCWKLSDEIVRVPASSITNRDRLIPLGSGKLGAVHKAIIRLHDDTLCAAAIKTDQCRVSWWSLRQSSCLTPSTQLWHPRSFAGAEYTGALVWYAQRKLGRSVPGLLPTWAVIEDQEHPLYSPPTKYGELEGFPHPDASIKGVIMPLGAFTTVSKILEEDNNSHRTSAELARIMLSAAKGLEFVGSMGLAFRDLLDKNVGVLPTGKGILYDNSFMGVQHVKDCTSIACNFCMEDSVFPPFDDFYHHVVKGIQLGHPYILGDMHNFRNVIIKLAKQCTDQERATNMTGDVLHTTDVHHLIRVLAQYADPDYFAGSHALSA